MSETTRPEPLDYTKAVHRVARLVPPGRALSYGDVAELLGSGGARQVGKAMASAPEGVSWWRILRSDGTLSGALDARARPHWEAESLAVPGRRVNMSTRRWQPDQAGWQAIDRLRQALGNPKLSEADDQL